MQNFVKNNTEIMQQVLKMQQIYLLSKYIKWISKQVLLHTLTYAKTVWLKD